MIGKHYPVYSEYKDSGVEWLGEIPKHWEVNSLRRVVNKFVDYRGATPEKVLTGIPLVTAKNIKNGLIDFEISQEFIREEDYFDWMVRGFPEIGDVLVTTEAPLGETAQITDTNIALAQRVILLKLNQKKVVNDYIKYWFISKVGQDELYSQATGSTALGIKASKFKGINCLVPSIEEQETIAQFLDTATAEIDEIIEQQQQLISLLEEERTTVISHAVTKGIERSVPMKYSGIKWLGEIPEHWEMKRLKHISPSISVGLVINPSTYVSEDGTVPFLFGSNIKEEGFLLDDVRFITQKSNIQLSVSMLSEGDIVTVRVGYPGVSAVIPKELDGANCASMMIIRKKSTFISEFICKCMNSLLGKTQVDMVIYGAAQKQFNVSHAVDFIFPFPPLEEQKEICNYINQETAKIDEAIAIVQQQIELLEEYRTTLISDAVTGKIDVRGIANEKS